jgi:hypothetical protein
MPAAVQTKNSSLTPKAHGLTYVPSNLFQQNEAIHAQYDELREKLFDQCAPRPAMALMVGHSQPRYQKVFRNMIPLKNLNRTNPI